MQKKQIFELWISFNLSINQIEKIILKITGLTYSQLFLDNQIEKKYFTKIKNSFKKYKKWVPFEYLIKNSEFYWLNFYVDKRVLIPRNETEILVYEALKQVKKEDDFILIDVWTWSSCIPISLLKKTDKTPKKTIVLDISKKALEVSQINIKNHNLQDKIISIKSNLLNYLIKNKNLIEKNTKTLIITANLPYIKNLDFENMDSSVINFEPKIALYWGKKTWFELYEKLINQCFKIKKLYSIEKIVLFIEIWFDQFDYCKNFLEKTWLNFEYFKDNCWIFRCFKINML